jgi:hypothetical protein
LPEICTEGLARLPVNAARVPHDRREASELRGITRTGEPGSPLYWVSDAQ